jgi:hypothetical protein
MGAATHTDGTTFETTIPTGIGSALAVGMGVATQQDEKRLNATPSGMGIARLWVWVL